jgi:hypothetical protein|tara:strand:- start:112 stop:258 length:147 start_codon:yes stop_codon:yes gene_type:complete
MSLDIKIEPETFTVKGKVPDKILYIILGILCLSLGLNGEEILSLISSF